MKKSYVYIILIVSGITILLIARALSLQIALRIEGLNANDIHVIEHSINNNQEFQVIQTSSKEHQIILVSLIKNKIGFWKIDQLDEDNSFTKLGWVEGAGSKVYVSGEDPVFEQEWHLVYSGNKATKLIEISPDQLPANVTVNTQQSGQMYWIHIVSYGGVDSLKSLEIEKIIE